MLSICGGNVKCKCGNVKYGGNKCNGLNDFFLTHLWPPIEKTKFCFVFVTLMYRTLTSRSFSENQYSGDRFFECCLKETSYVCAYIILCCINESAYVILIENNIFADYKYLHGHV